MADPTDFMKRAYAFFLDKGYAPHQAAALAGHGDWESGGRTNAYGDRGTAYGLFQWRGARQDDLNRFAKARNLDPKDENTQLAFADWELNNTEKAAGAALRGSSDLTGANNAMMGFLRPQGYTPSNPQAGHGYVNRYNNSASLVTAPNMTETLAMAPPQHVGAGPGANPVMATGAPGFADAQTAAATTPPDQAPAAAAATPVASAKPKENPFDSIARNGLSMMAMGGPQSMQAPQMSPAPGAPQMSRGTPMQGSLLDAVFPGAQRKKNLGLLADVLG